jgi:hypothetical protein
MPDMSVETGQTASLTLRWRSAGPGMAGPAE